MTLQFVLVAGVVCLSSYSAFALISFRYYGYMPVLLAHISVIAGSFLAWFYTEAWAGWLALALYALFVIGPQTIRSQSASKVRQAVNRSNTNDIVDALSKIEAEGYRSQRTAARLSSAYETCRWSDLLALSRAQDGNPIDAKMSEIRSLGELGRANEMVLTYQAAARFLPPSFNTFAQLVVFACTGTLEGVQHLLRHSNLKMDYDSHTYFTALARLMNNRDDELGRAMMQLLSKTAIQDRLRRLALHHIEISNGSLEWPIQPLSQDSKQYIGAMLQALLELQQKKRERKTASLRAFFILILISIAVGLIEALFR